MNDVSPKSQSKESPAYEEPQAPPYVAHRDATASDEIENLPRYTEQHDPSAPISIQDLNRILKDPRRERRNDVTLWKRFIKGFAGMQASKDLVFAERYIIKHFFLAIVAGKEDVISLLIENHLVTVNTKLLGITPLLMAVSEKNVRIVHLLLELGAEPDQFGNAVS